jgi:hypothetical protein
MQPNPVSYWGLSGHLHASFQEGAEILSKSTGGASQVLRGSPGGLHQFCGCLIQPSSSFIQSTLSFLKCPSARRKLQDQRGSQGEELGMTQETAWEGWTQNLGVMKGDRSGKSVTNKKSRGRKGGVGVLRFPTRPDSPTESLRSLLLASPTALKALSTSLWPGRQLTQRFSA